MWKAVVLIESEMGKCWQKQPLETHEKRHWETQQNSVGLGYIPEMRVEGYSRLNPYIVQVAPDLFTLLFLLTKKEQLCNIF